GGLAAKDRLTADLRTLRDKLQAAELRHIDWAAFASDCAAVGRDVDAMDALGQFPFPDGRTAWLTMKSRPRDAVDLLCHQQHTAREFQPLQAAAQDVAEAESAEW